MQRKDIVDANGYSKSTMERALDGLVQIGKVKRVGRGIYRKERAFIGT